MALHVAKGRNTSFLDRLYKNTKTHATGLHLENEARGSKSVVLKMGGGGLGPIRVHRPSRGVWAMPPSQEILVFRLWDRFWYILRQMHVFQHVYRSSSWHPFSRFTLWLSIYFDTSALNVLTSSQFQNNMLSQSVKQ